MRMNERTDWTDAWPFVHSFVCVLSIHARIRMQSVVVEKKEKKNVDLCTRPTVVSCCLIWTTCSDMYIFLSPVFWPTIDLFLFLSYVLFLFGTRRLYAYSNTEVCMLARLYDSFITLSRSINIDKKFLFFFVLHYRPDILTLKKSGQLKRKEKLGWLGHGMYHVSE